MNQKRTLYTLFNTLILNVLSNVSRSDITHAHAQVQRLIRDLQAMNTHASPAYASPGYVTPATGSHLFGPIPRPIPLALAPDTDDADGAVCLVVGALRVCAAGGDEPMAAKDPTWFPWVSK